MKILIFVIILIIGVVLTLTFPNNQKEGKNSRAIIGIIISIAIGVFSSYLYDEIKNWVDNSSSQVETKAITENKKNTSNAGVTQEIKETTSIQSDNSAGEQDLIALSNYIEDVSDKESFNGSIKAQDQENIYKYVPSVGGTYRFDTNLSSGGSVRIQVNDENNDDINYDYDALSIDLEAGKTYMLSVGYRNGPCDYTVNIGVPIPVTDITGSGSVSGNITYQDQRDEYYYTAQVTGTYRFDTDLSSGGSVKVRISGENGTSLDYDYDALTIYLEAGKKYILSIEYINGICDYTVNIGVPIPVTDITGSGSVSGSIAYQDQKDEYYYTAQVTGTYRFDTDLSSGGSVKVRISGENGTSLDYNYDALTIYLEASKKYILSIEYTNGICDYTINIGVPIPITDITGSGSASGSITYQDQKDEYYYIAPVTGTYCFDTNLSSGGSVKVRISGENGASLDYDYDALNIDLEAGKKYILGIEYQNSFCSYEIFIVTPYAYFG